ncbi:hypothetical protein [Nesterenkonia rhizosphaerae]|uniref:Uncharacterized protein n=1 Tax=Nesterenkonia rhizosphaerae TaxID=1348272 RepID=A0ABP9FTB7_9MICC
MLERLRSELFDVARGWHIYEVGSEVGSLRNNSAALLEAAAQERLL